MSEAIGEKATCAMCGKPITFVGPYWDHDGEIKPRHPATPTPWGTQVAQEKPNVEVVIPIDLNKKYLLVFDGPVTHRDAEAIGKSIEDWLKSSHPFMVIAGGIKLERVYAIEGSGRVEDLP